MNKPFTHCRRIWLAVVLFLGVSTAAPGQLYQVHRYTGGEGLPAAEVYDVAQDHSGRMWFATRGGIASYDGVSWKTYSTADGLRSIPYFRLRVDRRGRIWVMAMRLHKGLRPYYYDGRRWHATAAAGAQVPQPDFLTAFRTAGPGEAGADNMPVTAVGTKKHGLFLRKQGIWRNFTPANGLPGPFVTGIAVLGNTFYVATNAGLAVIDTGGAGPFAIDTGLNQTLGLPSTDIRGITVEDKDKYPGSPLKSSRVWLMGRDWIAYFDETATANRSNNTKNSPAAIYPTTFSVVGEEPLEMLPDYRCGIYAGEDMRIYYFNYKTLTWDTLDVSNGLVGKGLISMTIDFEKNIWITNTRGVSKIVSRRFGNYNSRNGLLEDEVTAVLEYEPGKFVLGHEKGFSFMEGNTITELPLKGKIGGDYSVCRVLDIKLDRERNIWAALDAAGLVKVDRTHRVTWYGESHGLQGSVTSLCFDHRRRLWVGTTAGLYLKTGGGFSRITSRRFPTLGIRKVLAIGAPPAVKILAASWDSGMYTYDPNRRAWDVYRLPGKNRGNNVYAIKKEDNGSILLGSLAGVFVLDLRERTYKRFNPGGFELRRPVYFITGDHRRRLWFGTLNGATRWDGKESRVYSAPQGLAGRETNRAAGVVDGKGRMWIGTDRGVSIYHEHFDSPSDWTTPPKVQLDSIHADNRRIQIDKPGQPLYLGSNVHNLVFNFSAISFKDERANHITYKLDGFDTDWIDDAPSYTRTARYSNLAPGTYRFQLKAKNSMGVASALVTSPKIFIPTPYYRKWWFYLLVSLSAAFILYFIFRYFTRARYAALLEKQVEERTGQLKKVQQQLMQSQKMEAIGTLAGGIAHDFNNILGVIVGYSELVLEDLGQDTLAHRNAEQVLTAAKRAAELVKQILAFSRQSKQERKPLNVSSIINEALKLLRSTLPTTIEIRRQVQASSSVVMADATQVHQVMMNLCANAGYAMREKGGVLEVHLDEVDLDEEAVKKLHGIKPGTYVRLTVSDTGQGIPRVVMKRIFEPYFTTKDTGQGTGLGLAVIHGIIKSHGGDISVYSEPGMGTTFYVFLPCIEEKAGPDREPTSPGVLPGGNESILLIDDEIELVRASKQILERLGYKVTGRLNPLHALELFRTQPDLFDLIITDFTMPKMTGLQVAKAIKKIKPKIPIILCTGFAASISHKEIESRVDDYVMKPVIKSELAKIVRQALDR
jgi:signal transduction histidine kinase/ligand-binding sensor domain-containing protein